MSITAKNKEQELAIKAGINFIEHGDPKQWLVVGGKAGTGKTTIAEAILAKYIKRRRVLVSALSHKAKLVISEKLERAYGQKSFVSKSIAGALGMNMDNETGNFTVPKIRIAPPIKTASIIIVDEGSMVNEESLHLIMSEKRGNAKVIFLADIRQLPPIREVTSTEIDKPSPVFFGPNFIVLTERIRQGEESPILPFADFFGDNTRLRFPVAYPLQRPQRHEAVTEKGALVFADNMADVIEAVLPLYQHAVKNHDMNVVKVVSYRNETRREINKLVREYVFGLAPAREQFVVGDLLMFHDNYNVKDVEDAISNSYEFQVNKVERAEDEYKLWILHFIFEKKPVTIKVLDSSEVSRHGAAVSDLFRYAKSLPAGSEERTAALRKAWGLKNRYAPIEYAYAITSHKSQGSTYNTVVVDELDIMSVMMTSNKAKSQSMYTALTRASTTCIVVDGQPATDNLSKAIELSISKYNG